MTDNTDLINADNLLTTVHEKDGAPVWVLGRLQDWSREKSLWPVMFGLACCAIEMMATSASK